MTELEYGSVTIQTENGVIIPEKAGHLSSDEYKRLVAGPRGIGKACHETARCLEKTVVDQMTTGSLTPADLRRLGQQAEDIEAVNHDLRVLADYVNQAYALKVDEAFRGLRRVYGAVKSESDFDPSLRAAFEPLFDYFAVYSNNASSSKSKTNEAPQEDVVDEPQNES